MAMNGMKRFSTRDAARILGVSEDQIRTYARLGEIVPLRGAGGRLEFEFTHLVLLRTTKGLLEAGVPARRLRRVWTSLKRQLEKDLPLTGITIFADGERAVAWDGTAAWRPDSGQFLLNFDVAEVAEVAERAGEDDLQPASIVFAADDEAEFAEEAGGDSSVDTLTEHTGYTERTSHTERTGHTEHTDASFTAEQWFHLGCELEGESTLEARQAYLQTIALDPDFGDAHLNLGRLEHEAGELGKAESHYREAVRCSPEDPTYHFNLGVLLEDRGRRDEAVLAYERVVAADPFHADAHYNLGLLLETMARRAEAMKHLMIARRLYAGAGHVTE
jgi:tetratricopeptide (TPR) repeat protein